ncbi:MAG TPA: tetratricopeptide repeat protein [Thermoanaerobaculia bacterium]|nr:tetratricopeptide repeat protein [Thermoanaerobaculia bacterium]
MSNRLSATCLVLALLLGLSTVASADDWSAGVKAFKARNYAEAARDFQAVVKDRPDWAGGHYMLGRALLNLKRDQEALSELRKAYDKTPSDPNVGVWLAQAYVGVGRYDDALTLLDRIKSEPMPGALKTYADQVKAAALSASGHSSQAVSSLCQAAEASSRDATLQYRCAEAALAAGDLTQAISAAERAIRLDPNDAAKQKLFVSAQMQLGRQSRSEATKKQAYDQALNTASKMVTSNPTYDNLLLKAEAELGATEYPAAVSTLQQAIAKSSNQWLPYYYLGQAHSAEAFRLDKEQKDNQAKAEYSKAEEPLKKALAFSQSAKNTARTWRQLGFVYEKERKYDQAISAYNKAGDSASVTRVKKNQEIAQYNKKAQAENTKIEQLKKQQEEIEKKLKELPGGPPPGNF